MDNLLDANVSLFDDKKDNFNSQRLKNLVTFKHVDIDDQKIEIDENDRINLEAENGLFHNFTPLLKPFNACIEWEKIENDRFMPRPQKGMD